MSNNKQSATRRTILSIGFVFILLPVLLWALSEVPKQDILKESISLITILSFSFMLLQFFLSRSSRLFREGIKMSKIVKWHKAIGYTFTAILLIHPFLIIVPSFFEPGISPSDAFLKILEMWHNPGLFSGIIAWILMLILGIKAALRDRLFSTYRKWRLVHGVLSLIFLASSLWHVVMLGRHSTPTMQAFYLIAGLAGGILYLKLLVAAPEKGKRKEIKQSATSIQ